MPEGQVHLMVQCMESWFLADRPALETYYGHGFKSNKLPGDQHIESIPKLDVMRGLTRATKDTNKGEYHETHDGFAILEKTSPTRVGNCSPHAKELIDFLLSISEPVD